MAEKPEENATSREVVYPWQQKATAFALSWIALASGLPFLWFSSWFGPGDFEFSSAMLYHSVMVPLLVLFYLLVSSSLRLPLCATRWFPGGAILSVLFAGLGALVGRHTGFSLFAVLRIAGMIGADVLGVAVAVSLVRLGRRRGSALGSERTAFLLLLTSVLGVLLAAPLGHLAGWSLDFGLISFPGAPKWLRAVGLQPEALEDALIASHSHLIVAALLCGLTALAAVLFASTREAHWRSRVRVLGFWLAGLALVAAAALYLVSAATGWEPPALFASPPNGMPLDDVLLTLMWMGFLAVALGMANGLWDAGKQWVKIRTSLRWNLVFGFLGAVVVGVYIEFREVYYGSGELPAPGALKDQVFVRAHMLYPFLLLPTAMAFLLAFVANRRYFRHETAALSRVAQLVLAGMTLGLAGELLWFCGWGKGVFVAGTAVLVLTFVAAAWIFARRCWVLVRGL